MTSCHLATSQPVMSIILLGGGSTCDYYPWCIGPHCTGLPLCTQPQLCPHPVQGPGPLPLLVTSGGQDWIPIQTCALEDLTVQVPSQWWHLVGGFVTCALEDLTVQVPNQWWHLVAGFVRWVSDRYASYWNAFLSAFWFDCLFSSRSLFLHFWPCRDVINKISAPET